jgi:pimeloyl-ACP methyl ester carboxylesterase
MKDSDKQFHGQRKKRRAVLVILVVLAVLFQVCRQLILPNEDQLRHDFHLAVQARFPEAARNLADRMGIHPFEGVSPADNLHSKGRVILVHGLDDPGIIWDDLAPVLQENRFQVFFMSYPNDQAIQASSRLFFDQMQGLANQDPAPVSIVTHSMGGLVARDMLTCPELNYPGAAAAGTVPKIRQLIFVAPPNQGAHLARFRIVTEIKDQIYHLSVPGTHWLHCLLDGTGAAGVDLLPGSRFLNLLNQRPLPANVKMDIIAGMILFSRKEGGIKERLGDGLVSVNTTRLDGVSLLRVPGNHFSMIRNLTRSSTRIPPAVPVIVELLE